VPRNLRLFFALWPDPATRSALAATARELRQACGGRSPPAANLHLTLAFLGAVGAYRLPELRALADAVVTTPFDLDLVRVGCWRAQRLAWAAPPACPPALTALTGQLTDGLRRHGFHTERRAFKPHVTLLRNVVTVPPVQDLAAPLRWPVRGFVLVCSEPAAKGVQYRVIGQWPPGDARL
jgi:2'-5' RNA ligase